MTKPGPSTATVMIASRIAGIDSMMSTSRMMTISTQPRNQAASMPSSVPTVSDTATESKRHEQRHARAVDDAPQEIAAELVGAEPISPPAGREPWRAQAGEQCLPRGIGWRDVGRERWR